jgi:hypothetical protein
MREIECPYCLNVNRVAGLFEMGRAEGYSLTLLYCAFCGETFTLREVTEEAEPKEHCGNGRSWVQARRAASERGPLQPSN